MAIQIGDIIGDYEVTGLLGRGGMGKVFRVRNQLTDRQEAMKVVLSDLDDNPAFAERFLREMKVHASLQHPNIAALYSAHRIDGRLVMILELVEGVSLEEMLRPEAMDAAQAASYMTQVLDALGYAHERGVVHRDIKPANILIGPSGAVKLTDFGIARQAAGERLTAAGLAVGTLAYMSPEQILAVNVDGRSDIYSLGLTYYELVTGRRAMQGETEHTLMSAQLYSYPPPPSVLNASVSEVISAAIMRSMAKEPERRFQTAAEFRAAIASAPAVFAHAAPPPAATVAIPRTTASHNPTELAELETRLTRVMGPIAKHMITDAARRYGTISEIRQALAAQIENPKEREAFFKGASATAAGSTQMRAPATTFDQATLDRLTQALAVYLGPIAKMVVARAAPSSRTMEDLRCAAAAEIDSAADRQKFLDSIRGIG